MIEKIKKALETEGISYYIDGGNENHLKAGFKGKNGEDFDVHIVNHTSAICMEASFPLSFAEDVEPSVFLILSEINDNYGVTSESFDEKEFALHLRLVVLKATKNYAMLKSLSTHNATSAENPLIKALLEGEMTDSSLQ